MQLLLLLVLVGPSCARPAPIAQGPDREPPPSSPAAPAGSSEPGFVEGERLVVIILSHGFTVGEVELAVGPRCIHRGVEVLQVRSHAERIGLYGILEHRTDDLLSWLDVLSGIPLRARSVSETDKRISDTSTVFGQDGYRYLTRRTYKRKRSRRSKRSRRPPRWQDRPLPEGQPANDAHSGLGLLRSRAAELVAGRLHMVFTRRLWRVDVDAATREPVRIDAGSYEAIRLDGTARRLSTKLKPRKQVRSWSLWLSDNSRRLPLKARVESRKGIVELELKSHELRSAAGSGLERCR